MTTKRRREASTPKNGAGRPARPRLPKLDPNARPIWDVAEELAADVPGSEWRKVPTDLAKNLHHYLHGGPKEDAE